MTRLAKTIILMIFTLVVFITPGMAQALTIVQPADVGVNTDNLQEDVSYSIPTRILVTPLFLPEGTNVKNDEWYQGLYYFLTGEGNRPGFTDIPFHYVISSDGEVYKGNAGGEERKVFIDGYGTDVIVVAYLADEGKNTFNPKSTDEITEMLIAIANRHAIKPQNIDVESVDFVLDDEAQTVSLVKQEIFGIWKQDLEQMKLDVNAAYKPKQKQYQVEITGIEFPDDNVDSGGVAEAKVTIKNIGEYGIYAGTLSELVATRSNSGTSRFYLNGTWLAPGQFGLMSENDVLLPDKEATYTFKLATPLYFGEQKEVFRLQNTAGEVIENSDFEVALNINRPEGTIVQVSDTPTGFLRVRSEPFGLTDNEIARVSPGQRFFLVEDTNSAGWAKIRLNDGQEGWVAGNYIVKV